MLIPRDITGQRFAPAPFVAAPFETVSVFCIKDTFDPNHISRVTGRLVTLSDGTEYVCGRTSIVRVGAGSAYRTLHEAIAGLRELLAQAAS
ncbi:MAG: hypothetical protein QOJ51_3691 [Acidobacteriaceae bacterium]|jgi:hypothetical protein|nr:hypothetical protein [Acidobacteriaceae bacterium]MEA2260866.1 hypothetical protein [Acidobacteriaceae bacterium]